MNYISTQGYSYRKTNRYGKLKSAITDFLKLVIIFLFVIILGMLKS